MSGRMDSIDMAEWRRRYPSAMLPAYFDDVEFLHRPSSYVDEATRIWIAAIFWSMGDESVTILDLHGAHAAREHMLAFGEPLTLEDELEDSAARARAHVDARRTYETQYPRTDRP